MKITIDSGDIKKNKVNEINNSQSTLNKKNFTFKTHSGSVISVKGQGYGWALNVEKKETTRMMEALEKKGRNRFLLPIFMEKAGTVKVTVMKLQRIMALAIRMLKCQFRNSVFGFTKKWAIGSNN
ncbi:hypothetical protein GCM10020331_008400 [Ectobacillus funiculus]